MSKNVDDDVGTAGKLGQGISLHCFYQFAKHIIQVFKIDKWEENEFLQSRTVLLCR